MCPTVGAGAAQLCPGLVSFVCVDTFCQTPLAELQMNACRIVLTCVVGAVLYGIVHDQITARVCIEYFTIGHPPIIGSQDPTLLGLAWGVLATWWVGGLLGVALAIVACQGSRPPVKSATLTRPIAWILLVMAMGSLSSGVVGWQLAARGCVFLVGPLFDRVPQAMHVAFIADLWAHSASYLLGFVGGIVLMIKTWRTRHRQPINQ